MTHSSGTCRSRAGEGATLHVVALGLPRLASGAEHEALAGAGVALHDRNVRGLHDVVERPALVGRQFCNSLALLLVVG